MKLGQIAELATVLFTVAGVIAVNLRGIPDTAILARLLADIVPLAGGATAGCITAMGFIALGTVDGLRLAVFVLLSGIAIISFTDSTHLIGNSSALAAIYTQIVVMAFGVYFKKE